MFKKPYKAVFIYYITTYIPNTKTVLKAKIKGFKLIYINKDIKCKKGGRNMPVNYNSQQFFKGKDRQYDRFELKRMWCEIPQNKRTIDMIFKMTGIPKYHLKELFKVDNWKEEAEKEDEFKIIAKKNEEEMLSEENRKKFIETKYIYDKKLFEKANKILNSDEFINKIEEVIGEAKTIREIKDIYSLLMQIQDNYRDSIGLNKKPDKLNLTQNNYYDLRNLVQDEIYTTGNLIDNE